MHNETAHALLEFIRRSPSCYHVVENLKGMLEDFRLLREEDTWTLEPGRRYCVTRNGSSLIAIRLPRGPLNRLRIAAAHSDFPSFKLKPNAELVQEGYRKLNTEKYGGVLFSPWLDRPLSAAGRVMVRSGSGLAVRLVNLDRDLCLIPSLAIHMDRTLNDGYAFNPQVDLLPLLGEADSGPAFLSLLAQEVGVAPEDVLDYDLYLYNRTPGTIWGARGEYLSTRSLDDLQCVWPLAQGFLRSEESEDCGAVLCVFDSEEVGSGSRQGAGSTFLTDVLERVFVALGLDAQGRRRILARSTLVSADNAHAVHPNRPEKADPTNRPRLNGGIVLKYNAAQRYTTDALSAAWFKLLCEAAQVPWQSYVNRSDVLGGTTLGCIALRRLGISAIDIGLPQLAMHSPYETAGVRDTEYLLRAMSVYFSGTGVPTELS